MKVRIRRSDIYGELRAMSSKSDVQRALICAAFGDRSCRIISNRVSDDMEATMGCLNRAGADISYDEEAGTFIVKPVCLARERGRYDTAAPFMADCRESGSTLRFLIPVFSAIGADVIYEGQGRLPERPLGVILSELAAHGASIEGDRLPIHISGRIKPGGYKLPGNVSSQFISGLLLSFPLMEGSSSLSLTTELESSPYVDMTIYTMRRFGVSINMTDGGFSFDHREHRASEAEKEKTTAEDFGIVTGQREIRAGYRSPDIYEADGDWSNAAFFLAANALYRREAVAVKGLRPDSVQGDRAIASLLETITRDEPLTMDAREIPDLVPITAAVMALSPGEHRIINAGRLRIKESDRLSAMAEGLGRLGAEVTELRDGLLIRGSRDLKGGIEVSSFNDHRIAMALSIAALFCREPVTVDGAEAVRKSFPDFYDQLLRLHGDVEYI